MTLTKKHLVYIIESPSGKFYVGRTCNFVSRMYSHKNSGASKRTKLGAAIHKYGWRNFEVSVIEDNLSYDQVIEREKFFISLLQTIQYGYNILKGGAGYDPDVHTMKTYRKIRALNITTGEMTVFNTVTDAAEVLNIHSGKICTILNKRPEKQKNGNITIRTQTNGYTFEDYIKDAPDMTYEPPERNSHTEETKKLIGSAARGRGSKSVRGHHVLGYTVEFNAINDAAKELGLDNGDISKSAKGIRGRVGGFTWEYVDEDERKKFPKWDTSRRKGAHCTPVYRILTDGTKEEYASIEIAANILGCSASNIRNSIKRNGKAYGYIWKLKNKNKNIL